MLSVTATRLVNPDGGRYVGAENFQYLIASDPFWHSVVTTLLYTGFTVIAVVLLGTAAAVALDARFFGRSVVRAIATIPWAIPTIAASLIFAWIYNDQQGILGQGTRALGLGQPGWLTDPDWGLFSVTVATVWKAFPLAMLVMLAALQSVPHELKEAAWIDGATRWQTFRAVTLPHLAPTIRVLTLLMTIWSIRRFEIIYVMTGGGPIDATNTLVVSIYNTAFADQHLGRAAAIGVLALGLSLTVTMIYFVVERRRERKGES
ncbi:carbohydrate ABC transporter permease [Ruania rhizosphaerae]|uniref:carbohydrate ABC transporter permease n=1 Tax=Ruania rhizosphaerae TaxID=1840413 RepID=UPI00190F5A39|nr:sugar ABC transporter permease [Ruania rhizosphaerae]